MTRWGVTAPVVTVLLIIGGCTAGGRQDAPAPTSPSPDPSRHATQDYAVLMHSCLLEAGWETTIGPDNSIESEVPNAQADAFREASDACVKQLGYDQLPPITRDDAEHILTALVDAADCMRARGFDVPPQPPESESLDGLMSPDRDPHWDVYGAVAGSAAVEAQDQCPIDG